jgi:hypothetical protein
VAAHAKPLAVVDTGDRMHELVAIRRGVRP